MKRILLPLLLTASVAHAEFWDGNRLLQRMDSGNHYEQGTALGYIMGVADTLMGVSFCSPPGVSAGQVHDMVRNYLINMPSERHHTGDILIGRVLRNAWPCANNRRGQPL